MEDSVVDRFHTGPMKHLFDRKYTVRNYPGSGNNWAEGYFTHGRKYHERIEETIRQAVEECNNLHGFLVLHSVGGGTGSGLGSYILNILEENYCNIDRYVKINYNSFKGKSNILSLGFKCSVCCRFATCVYPNGTEDVITCPYNMTLTTKNLIDYATCVFPIENRSLLEIVNHQCNQKCSTHSARKNLTPFEDMNSIIVNMLLHITW